MEGCFVETQFSLRVKQVSNAMLNLGMQPQENVAVFSQNCVQYLYTDFGAYGIRVVTIPIYATSSEQQIQYDENRCSRLSSGDQSGEQPDH